MKGIKGSQRLAHQSCKIYKGQICGLDSFLEWAMLIGAGSVFV